MRTELFNILSKGAEVLTLYVPEGVIQFSSYGPTIYEFETDDKIKMYFRERHGCWRLTIESGLDISKNNIVFPSGAEVSNILEGECEQGEFIEEESFFKLMQENGVNIIEFEKREEL